jgi:hypothetical protein
MTEPTANPRRHGPRSQNRQDLYREQRWFTHPPAQYVRMPLELRKLLPYFAGRGDRLAVYTALLLAADSRTSECKWSQPTLAEHTDISLRNVNRVLGDLRKLGFISDSLVNSFNHMATAHVVFGLGRVCDHLLELRDNSGRLLTVKDGELVNLDLPAARMAQLEAALVKNGYWASQVFLARTRGEWLAKLSQNDVPGEVVQAIEDRLLLRKDPPQQSGSLVKFTFIERPEERRLGRPFKAVFHESAKSIAEVLGGHLGLYVTVDSDTVRPPGNIPAQLNGVLLLFEEMPPPQWWERVPDLREFAAQQTEYVRGVRAQRSARSAARHAARSH